MPTRFSNVIQIKLLSNHKIVDTEDCKGSETLSKCKKKSDISIYSLVVLLESANVLLN